MTRRYRIRAEVYEALTDAARRYKLPAAEIARKAVSWRRRGQVCISQYTCPRDSPKIEVAGGPAISGSEMSATIEGYLLEKDRGFTAPPIAVDGVLVDVGDGEYIVKQTTRERG